MESPCPPLKDSEQEVGIDDLSVFFQGLISAVVKMESTLIRYMVSVEQRNFFCYALSLAPYSYIY